MVLGGDKNIFGMAKRLGIDNPLGTPRAIYRALHEYTKWVDNNPWQKAEYRDKVGIVAVPTQLPYSTLGFCLFCGITKNKLSALKAKWKREQDDTENCTEEVRVDAENSLEAIEFLEDVCTHQKFDGAAAGYFNANLISRDLGLADKKQIEGNIHPSDSPIEFT